AISRISHPIRLQPPTPVVVCLPTLLFGFVSKGAGFDVPWFSPWERVSGSRDSRKGKGFDGDLDRAGQRRKAGGDQFDSSDADSVSSISTGLLELANDTECLNSQEFELEKYIDDLYEKRYLFYLLHNKFSRPKMNLFPYFSCLFVLDCLAVVTFVGANDLAETEISLKAIWQVIYPKSVAFLSTLLEDNDRSVRVAAGEAIALFFELGILDLHRGDHIDIDSLNHEVLKHGMLTYMQSMKAKILAKANDLSVEAGGKGTDKKNLNDQRDLFQKILDYVQYDNDECDCLFVGQLNFLKRFLGRGFLKHAQVLIYPVHCSDSSMLYICGPSTCWILLLTQKISRSEGDKGRTQKMKKDRKLAQERKRGHLISQEE
ncbi:hypothetical protein BHE74_00039259, partial [Ensete ventricosum]